MKSSNTSLTISINILYTFYTIICVTRGSHHEIESSTCHRRSTVTTEGQVHRGISNQNGMHCEVRKSAQTASSERSKMQTAECQNDTSPNPTETIECSNWYHQEFTQPYRNATWNRAVSYIQ